MSPGPPIRPDRRALLELDALLEQIIQLRDAGDRDRYDRDNHYRWVLHRLWIAVGNEARNYVEAVGLDHQAQPWRRLYNQRNVLAHLSLPDIDDDIVWRATVLRAEQQYRPAVHSALTNP